MRRALTALVVMAPLLAAANPSQDVDRARGEYSRGEYKATAALLQPLLYPCTGCPSKITDENELREAHYLLGVSYFYLRQVEDSRRELIALLFIDPDYKLDPVAEDPELYAMFEQVRKQLKKDLEEMKKKRLEEDRKKNQPPVILRTVTYRSPLYNFIPFGAPQYQNGRPGWGKFFLITQGAFAGTSMALTTYQWIRYGFPVPRRPPESEIDTVRNLQVAQIGTGAFFFLFYAWGVIDGYSSSKPKVVEQRLTQPPPPRTSSLKLFPILTPDTTGVGALWEF